ncbi:MAG: thermonuclease family protein [Pseudomonadota bacterium]
MALWARLFVCFALVGCADPSPLPEMQSGETGRVVRIIDGDALVLDTGQSVRLVSVQAPVLNVRDGVPEPYSGESARLLEDLALGRRVQLFYPGITRDRYDRALAHVMTIDGLGPEIWLNKTMIERGAARVRLYPSTAARGRDLLAAEAAARESQTGLWQRSAYKVRDAASLNASDRGFMLVRGTLGPAVPFDRAARFAPACERLLAESELRLAVRSDAGSACGLSDGSVIEVRGFVSQGRLELTHPFHIEIETGD